MSTSPVPGEGIFRFAASSPRRAAAKTIASKKSLSDRCTLHNPLWYNPAYRRRREASTVDIKGAAHLIDKNHLRSVKIGGGDRDGVFRGKRVSAEHFLSAAEGEGFRSATLFLAGIFRM